MKLLSPEYRAFIYAFSLHAAVLSGAYLYTAQCESEACHEVYSLMHLKTLNLQAPAVEPVRVPVQKTLPVVKEVPTPKPVTHKPKPVKSAKVVKKTPEPTKQATCMCATQSEPEPEPVVEEVERQEVAKNEVFEQSEQTPSPVVASVDAPSVTYEAQYMEDNLALINALIKKHLQYPRLAKKRGLQGRTMISFTLNEEGEVIGIEALGDVASILKRSAVKTIKAASSDFPHPKQTLALQIPIVYSLR